MNFDFEISSVDSDACTFFYTYLETSLHWSPRLNLSMSLGIKGPHSLLESHFKSRIYGSLTGCIVQDCVIVVKSRNISISQPVRPNPLTDEPNWLTVQPENKGS